ncbi:MAG TPA: 4,5-DOPA dioxygenase extradiol, partial [Anaerolineales bacterium]|nr:4,5-DOPA dioxygenase extradiol [Anaerolineales bacterium]
QGYLEGKLSDNLMPVLFVGHGSPMNAIEDNEYSRAWREAAGQIRKPQAILCISAHWETHGSMVTAMEQPRTIHDFYGFPRPLFEKQYPAPGSAELAQRVIDLVGETRIKPDHSWGLDHGTWSVLCQMYPEANIPVVQLSLDRQINPSDHYALGQKLNQLRQEGILIVGSGNIVHNLALMVWQDAAFDWAIEYDKKVKQWIVDEDHDAIIHYEKHGKPALLSVNSAEHYLPLLYILGLRQPHEPVLFFAEKLWGGSLSMRCVRLG